MDCSSRNASRIFPTRLPASSKKGAPRRTQPSPRVGASRTSGDGGSFPGHPASLCVGTPGGPPARQCRTTRGGHVETGLSAAPLHDGPTARSAQSLGSCGRALPESHGQLLGWTFCMLPGEGSASDEQRPGQFFGTARHVERRATGRKQASPTLVIRGAVRVVAAGASRIMSVAESVQRIIVRRALEGHHVYDVEILKQWLTDSIAGWNRHPTPFIWGGKRHARRDRAYARRHRLGGACATTQYVLPRRLRSVRFYQRVNSRDGVGK
jgi:hypothetical protein